MIYKYSASRAPPLPPQLKDECEACISSFAKAGGCECIDNDDCNQFSLIPDGCFNCGEKAVSYCAQAIGDEDTEKD